jgi:F-type H+-transporting ATPase subunit b
MEFFMQEFIFLAEVPLEKGFGFNGNILETNIINLSVVIGVVVSFGGDALRSLVENRRQSILSTLQQAEEKAKVAQQKLMEAKTQLELAQQKAIEIREQGNKSAEKEKSNLTSQTEQDILRLEELKKETLGLNQQKAVAQVSQKVINLALTQVREKLKYRLDATFHESVNNFNIVLFTNYRVV